MSRNEGNAARSRFPRVRDNSSGMRRPVPLLVYLLACGNRGSSESVVAKRDDAGPRLDAGVVLAPLALGAPDVATFAYRTRAGHAAFKLAREGEAKGAWTEVAARCHDALAAD